MRGRRDSLVAVSERMDSAPGSGNDTARELFIERLYVPLWWWLFLFGVIAIVIGQGVFISSPWWVWLLLVLLGPLMIWLMWRLGREKVAIVDDGGGARSLVAGGATLPFDAISRCAVVPKTAKSAAMGRQLDPEAYVVHRGYVPTMAIVVLDDPSDPTPYWLISTRRPEELTDLLPGKVEN